LLLIPHSKLPDSRLDKHLSLDYFAIQSEFV
jgi:hypothetical protein